jgi:hypothetical protein
MDDSHKALLSFPARYLRDLPVETRFVFQPEGMKDEIRVSSSEVVDPAEAGVAFDGLEFALIVEGVEAGRVWPGDIAEWVRAKRGDPTLRLTRSTALGDVRTERGRALSLGRVLSRLGLVLVGVEVGARHPPRVAVEQAA